MARVGGDQGGVLSLAASQLRERGVAKHTRDGVGDTREALVVIDRPPDGTCGERASVPPVEEVGPEGRTGGEPGGNGEARVTVERDGSFAGALAPPGRGRAEATRGEPSV